MKMIYEDHCEQNWVVPILGTKTYVSLEKKFSIGLDQPRAKLWWVDPESGRWAKVKYWPYSPTVLYQAYLDRTECDPPGTGGELEPLFRGYFTSSLEELPDIFQRPLVYLIDDFLPESRFWTGLIQEYRDSSKPVPVLKS